MKTTPKPVKTASVHVRLTAEQMAVLDKASLRTGVAPSQKMRELALKWAHDEAQA